MTILMHLSGVEIIEYFLTSLETQLKFLKALEIKEVNPYLKEQLQEEMVGEEVIMEDQGHQVALIDISLNFMH